MLLFVLLVIHHDLFLSLPAGRDALVASTAPSAAQGGLCGAHLVSPLPWGYRGYIPGLLQLTPDIPDSDIANTAFADCCGPAWSPPRLPLVRPPPRPPR